MPTSFHTATAPLRERRSIRSKGRGERREKKRQLSEGDAQRDGEGRGNRRGEMGAV